MKWAVLHAADLDVFARVVRLGDGTYTGMYAPLSLWGSIEGVAWTPQRRLWKRRKRP